MGIAPGQATMTRVVKVDPTNENELPPGATFTVELDDPTVTEEFCFLS
jgi:hypothetical protein